MLISFSSEWQFVTINTVYFISIINATQELWLDYIHLCKY